MFIVGDPGLRYGDIVAVIDAAKGAGVEKVGIVTEGMRRGDSAGAGPSAGQLDSAQLSPELRTTKGLAPSGCQPFCRWSAGGPTGMRSRAASPVRRVYFVAGCRRGRLGALLEGDGLGAELVGLLDQLLLLGRVLVSALAWWRSRMFLTIIAST